MLENMKDMLNKAKENEYAVAQFNINNLEWTRFILEECQANQSPVILGVSEGAAKYMGGYKTVFGMVKNLMEHLNIITNISEIADMTGIMNAKQEDSKQKKLETSIDDLDFSVRAYNCLKRAGISTLGDLTEKSELEMMKIRNLGKKSLKEVIDKIKDMGLKFRDED